MHGLILTLILTTYLRKNAIYKVIQEVDAPSSLHSENYAKPVVACFGLAHCVTFRIKNILFGVYISIKEIKNTGRFMNMHYFSCKRYVLCFKIYISKFHVLVSLT